MSGPWIILRRVNGHAELVAGQTITLYDTEEEAKSAADAQMIKNSDQRVAWFEYRGQFQPRTPFDAVS